MAETTALPKNRTGYSRPILIIEDSLAISKVIEEFLTTLGYNNISVSNWGKEGIQKFSELVKSGRWPTVFLDCNLPDLNADEILPQILSIKPSTKIIVVTALDRNEQVVKDVVMRGAYFYIQKPLRLSNLQEAMRAVEGERYAIETKDVEINKVIESAVGSSYTSLQKICELCNVKPERALPYLTELENKGDIMSIESMKEPSCSRCGSVFVKEIKSLSTNPDYFCSRCSTTSRTDQVQWITTKAFRTKAKFNFTQRSPLM